MGSKRKGDGQNNATQLGRGEQSLETDWGQQDMETWETKDSSGRLDLP